MDEWYGSGNDADRAQSSAALAWRSDMNQPCVLFVDDEPNVLSALRRALRREPYSCLFAEGPDEALEMLAENDIDLVVSDHLMPSMDGLTFLKKVREMYPQVVRVILTGHADLEMAIEAINEGEVYRFLTKPWNDVELKITLKQLLDFIEVRRQNQMLMDTVDKQRKFIDRMDAEHPGIFEVERDDSGAIVLDLELDD
jgi:DNA-binding NtrC family response regulator